MDWKQFSIEACLTINVAKARMEMTNAASGYCCSAKFEDKYATDS
jgi:hypothetical protein